MDPITVGTADLRAALRAVTPHAAGPKDGTCHRVRLTIGDVNLGVSATSRVTAGHAIVSIEENTPLGDDDPTDGPYIPLNVDLTPTDAKEIATIFDGQPGDDNDPGDLLELTINGKELVITDTSGLFPGKSLTLPNYGVSEAFPDIPKLLSAMLVRTRSQVDRMPFDGTRLALFTAAAKAYDTTLILEPTGDQTALVITCGESFIGGIMPVRLFEDAALDAKQWREAWTRRLPATTKTEPIDLAAVMEAVADKVNSGALDKDGMTVTATVKRGQRPNT